MEHRNPSNRSILLRVTAAAAVFVLLYLALQEVFRYKWEREEDTGAVFESFEAQPANSIDVLFVGASQLTRGVLPMVLYETAGITSFNWGQAWGTAPIVYYQLLYCLKHQKPKLVVIDCIDFYETKTADAYKDSPYRRTVATMPDREIRSALIREICDSSPEQTAISYYLPLIKYHTRWSELTREDFIPRSRWVSDYREYQKGGVTVDEAEKQTGTLAPAADTEESVLVPSAYSLGFYEKISALCRENGIRLAVLTVPQVDHYRTEGQLAGIAAWCGEKDAVYLDGYAPALLSDSGLSPDTDYYDAGHLNTRGAERFTKALAPLLKEICDLPDRRGDADWEKCLAEFRSDYPEVS